MFRFHAVSPPQLLEITLFAVRRSVTLFYLQSITGPLKGIDIAVIWRKCSASRLAFRPPCRRIAC